MSNAAASLIRFNILVRQPGKVALRFGTFETLCYPFLRLVRLEEKQLIHCNLAGEQNSSQIGIHPKSKWTRFFCQRAHKLKLEPTRRAEETEQR